MQWTLSSDRPIYAQLTEQLTLRIITGRIRAGAAASLGARACRRGGG